MTTARRTGSLACALAALASGCGGALDTSPCHDGTCVSQTSTKATFWYSVPRRVDLLFVVDDTPAIAPQVDRIAAGFADMAAQLQDPGFPMSVHVGFVRAGSCDTSTRARGCGVTVPAQFVAMQPCNKVTNASGAFLETVACLGAFGDFDCAPNRSLASALQALDPANDFWDGFLRPDAYLQIVIVAATDDASGAPGAPTPVLDVAARLKALKPDPSQVLVSVLGPGDCATRDGQGPRLLELANQFGSNGLYMNLCDDPFSAALVRITSRENDALSPPCLTNVRDTDAATPGMQASCTVVQRITAIDTATHFIEEKIRSCDDGPPPCWQPPTASRCNDGSPGWIFNIDGPLDECVDGSVSVDIECLGCADPNDPACAPPPATP